VSAHDDTSLANTVFYRVRGSPIKHLGCLFSNRSFSVNKIVKIAADLDTMALQLTGDNPARGMMATLLRLYSYLYHGILALFLLGISVVAMTSDSHSLSLSMLPWKGDQLVHWLLAGSLIGLLSIVLAITGIFRPLFPIWALFVLLMMVWGYIIKPYGFSGTQEFYSVLWLIAGAFVAFLASLTLFRRRLRR
jgi:hypothetical protein